MKMFDIYTKKRMLAAVIFLGGLTFIVLIFESHWAFETSSANHFGNYSNLPKNASSDFCKSDEEIEVIEACHPCSDFEIASKSNKACIATHFKEGIKCQKSGLSSFRSCEKVQWLEEKKFWQFEFLAFVLALTSSASVVLRQKVLDQKHLRTLQRRLASSMGDLYLVVSSIDENRIIAPLETAICVLTHRYLESPSNVKIHLVVRDDESRRSLVTIDKLDLVSDIVGDIPPPASFCQAPVFNLGDGISCVAGLCSVLRQIIKHSDEQWNHLLGFREACLVACAEVSMWTKFCEVDLVAAAKEVIATWPGDQTSLPLQLARLEAHLSQPIRVHNVGKFKDKSHKYAEGPLFLVTDLILAVPVYVIIEKLQLWTVDSIALTAKWLHFILDDHGFRQHLCRLGFVRCETQRSWDLPPVARSSLYKRDPTRYKPRHKIFTQQSDIESSMEIVSGVDVIEYGDPFGCDVQLPADIPLPDVPDKRLDRKIQQLSNLAKSTLKVSKAGDLIVDFCSGSGHLGFIIAHALPSCSVVLLDNKEKSLDRARERREELGLNNVYIVQANLDYFVGRFQVGVSLHACGVASDLVIWKCLQSKASLLVCPCCYGGIQTNHVIQYPQSPEYRKCGLTERGYIVLAHCADQAGTEQGERGMMLVDTDRCLLAKSQGYCISLSKLIPQSCTTRNNLIAAVI